MHSRNSGGDGLAALANFIAFVIAVAAFFSGI